MNKEIAKLLLALAGRVIDIAAGLRAETVEQVKISLLRLSKDLIDESEKMVEQAEQRT